MSHIDPFQIEGMSYTVVLKRTEDLSQSFFPPLNSLAEGS